MAHDRSPPSERNASSARSVPTPHAVEAASAPSTRALRRTSTGRRIGVRPARAASPATQTLARPAPRSQSGLRGALADLEYQRIELIRFNLFDNSGTYRQFVEGRDGVGGLEGLGRDAASADDPEYDAVGGAGNQLCTGELIRFRNARPESATTSAIRAWARRTAVRPQRAVRSDVPDARPQRARQESSWRSDRACCNPIRRSSAASCSRATSQIRPSATTDRPAGRRATRNCDYKKAPFFNVLARVLDPVHDARLVLASRRRRKRRPMMAWAATMARG